jgi:hypothetical protein
VECVHISDGRRHNGDVTRLRPLGHLALTHAQGSEAHGDSGLADELLTSVSGAMATFKRLEMDLVEPIQVLRLWPLCIVSSLTKNRPVYI